MTLAASLAAMAEPLIASLVIRGVRVATPAGIQPASIHVGRGQIVAIAGYEEIPREVIPQELGKSVLMPILMRTFPSTRPALDEAIASFADALTECWTPLRAAGGDPIEEVGTALCSESLVVGGPASFMIWNPELVVIGSSPPTYGQLRQLWVDGVCVYRDGVVLPA